MLGLGTYPRRQRSAVIVLLLTLLAGCWLADRFGGLGQRSLGKLASEAGILRRTLAITEANDFRPAPEAFAFDPNTVTEAELRRLGLTERQATGWLKFRGNRPDAFRQPEDIGRLYVLSDDDKARLIPLAYVPRGQREKGARPRVRGFVFDPNTVGPEELRQLGLSEKQAAAFVNYRSAAKYGRAFRQPEDLRRVKTMSDQQRQHLIRWAKIPAEATTPVRPQQRFRFDPNVISADSLQLLGFPAWQARSLVKYRGNRTNTFRRPTDLRRVSALDSALVESVLELVDLAVPTSPAPARMRPDAQPGSAPATYAYRPKPPLPAPGSFDVNAADTTAWRSLPGIGGYRAKRIVRFRQALGGFATTDQIATTRGLPDSIFRAIEPYLVIGTPPRPLAINRATFDELRHHPYINRNLANSIVKNREKAGRFDGPEDLRRLRLMTPKKIGQLAPYFSFE